jgi:hypothetical protein
MEIKHCVDGSDLPGLNMMRSALDAVTAPDGEKPGAEQENRSGFLS